MSVWLTLFQPHFKLFVVINLVFFPSLSQLVALLYQIIKSTDGCDIMWQNVKKFKGYEYFNKALYFCSSSCIVLCLFWSIELFNVRKMFSPPQEHPATDSPSTLSAPWWPRKERTTNCWPDCPTNIKLSNKIYDISCLWLFHHPSSLPVVRETTLQYNY